MLDCNSKRKSYLQTICSLWCPYADCCFFLTILKSTIFLKKWQKQCNIMVFAFISHPSIHRYLAVLAANGMQKLLWDMEYGWPFSFIILYSLFYIIYTIIIFIMLTRLTLPCSCVLSFYLEIYCKNKIELLM